MSLMGIRGAETHIPGEGAGSKRAAFPFLKRDVFSQHLAQFFSFQALR